MTFLISSKRLVAAVVILTLWIVDLKSPRAAEAPRPRSFAPTTENLSLRNEVEHAIAKGLAWLEKNQDAKGFWSTNDHPALTALVLVALNGWPAVEARPTKPETAEKGFAYLLGCVQPDGGIYRTSLANYNTSISIMALLAANRAEYKPIILKARQFIVDLQCDFDEPGRSDNVLDGGIGYGSRYKHSDMSNTLMALEALHYSKRLLDDPKPAGERDLNWAAAIQFIQNCQNLPSYNKQAWASDDPQNKGGFVYFPGNSMAGETNLPSGRIALRSYGSISYAGLLSYIHADLKQDDPRVRAVFEWLRGNFTLEENPGMGPQGLFYYYHTMAKALSISQIDRLETTDGKKVAWRNDLALKLINLQKTDGSWANDNGRWWEKDPVLATAYAAISLEIIHRGL